MASLSVAGVSSAAFVSNEVAQPTNDSTLRKVLTCVPVVTIFMQASNGVWHNQQPLTSNVIEASIFHEKCTHATNLISIVAIAVVAATVACNPFIILGALMLVGGSSCLSLYRLEHYKNQLSKY